LPTFYDRDNNSCTAKIRLKGHKESRTFYPVGKRSARQVAEKWAKEEEEKILAGNYKSEVQARTTTLLDALDTYDENFASKLKGYSTEIYRINVWRRWKYKDTKLSDLTQAMFDEFRNERRKSVADGSIRLDLAVITALFSNTDYGIPNPAAATIATLAASKKRNRRLRTLEQEYLLDAVFDTQCSDRQRANQYLPYVVIFGIETACRMSEIVPDAREHTTGVLRENVVLNSDKSIAKIFDTKNGADRLVPLTPSAVEAVEKAMALSTAKKGEVFRTTASAIKQAWGRSKKRAIKQYHQDCAKNNAEPDETFMVDFHFHDLRHEAASRWKKFFDIHRLKDLTGHKDIRSLSRYLHSDEADIMDMAQEMAVIQNKAREDGDLKVIKFRQVKLAPKKTRKKKK
jgi:integrase